MGTDADSSHRKDLTIGGLVFAPDSLASPGSRFNVQRKATPETGGGYYSIGTLSVDPGYFPGLEVWMRRFTPDEMRIVLARADATQLAEHGCTITLDELSSIIQAFDILTVRYQRRQVLGRHGGLFLYRQLSPEEKKLFDPPKYREGDHVVIRSPWRLSGIENWR